MSTLHHEEILENLYDEAYVECLETGFFTTEDLDSAAQFLAQIRFEELAQWWKQSYFLQSFFSFYPNLLLTSNELRRDP